MRRIIAALVLLSVMSGCVNGVFSDESITLRYENGKAHCGSLKKEAQTRCLAIIEEVRQQDLDYRVSTRRFIDTLGGSGNGRYGTGVPAQIYITN